MNEHSDLKSKIDSRVASRGRLFHKVSRFKTKLKVSSNFISELWVDKTRFHY